MQTGFGIYIKVTDIMNIPIPFPHVNNMPDDVLVPKIKSLAAKETAEFFYGKAAPIFIKLYNGYCTDCEEVLEFINEIYSDIMFLRPVAKTRKIDGFAFECMFKNWIGKLALMYCYDKFKMREEHRKYLEKMAEEDFDEGMKENVSSLDMRDINALLNLMTCDNYRDVIRLIYLDGLTVPEAAIAMGVDDINNFYNMHRRAKLQYIQVYNKEMRL